MEYKDVQERLTGIVSNVSLPSDRKAAIWANIEKEIQKYERTAATRRRRAVLYRTLAVGAALACVAGIFAEIYDTQRSSPMLPTTDHTVARPAKPAVVLEFAGGDSLWAATLSQRSQDQKETDAIDLNFRGKQSLEGQPVTCAVLDKNGNVVEAKSAVVRHGMAHIPLPAPVHPVPQSFAAVAETTYPVRIQWTGGTDTIELSYKDSYTTSP
jgi:hypothetical protein